VLDDFFNKVVSAKFARSVYGVVVDESGVDAAATQALRGEVRARRLAEGRAVNSLSKPGKVSHNARPVMRIHDCLDIVDAGDGFHIACRGCKEDFGPADGNYKDGALYRVSPKDAITELPPPSGRKSLGHYIEYFCRGCATQIDVETFVPAVEGDEVRPVWDIQISPQAIAHAAARHGD